MSEGCGVCVDYIIVLFEFVVVYVLVLGLNIDV